MLCIHIRTLTRAVAGRDRRPVNRLIVDESPTSQFVTLFYGVLDLAEATLCFVNAGHNPSLLLRAVSGDVGTLEPSGIAVGVIDAIDLVEAETLLNPGDVLLMYTDGLTEAVNADDEEFGQERLESVLRDSGSLSASQLVNRAVGAARAFAATEEPFDDVTLIAVKRLA